MSSLSFLVRFGLITSRGDFLDDVLAAVDLFFPVFSISYWISSLLFLLLFSQDLILEETKPRRAQ